MKPSLLFFSAHFPLANGRQAGLKTSYYLCESLASHFDVHLLAFATESEMACVRPDALRIFASSEILQISNFDRGLGVLTAPWLPLPVAARNSHKFRCSLRSLLSRNNFDVAILDHTATWQYASELSSVPVLCGSAHDVLSQLWARKAQAARGPIGYAVRFEARRMRRWESDAMGKLTIVAPHSEKDGRLVLELQPAATVCPIQPWYSCFAAGKQNGSTRREPGSVLFWGAMDRAENIDAVRFALAAILPIIRKEVPDFRFYIAGSGGERLAQAAPDPNVVVTGFVDDVSALFSRMDIALLPLRQGAGIKVKTLECMSAGLAVVTTPVGIEGVAGEDGIHYLLGSTPEELAGHVIRLLKSPQSCRQIGGNAQEMVPRAHDFHQAAERLCAVLLARVDQRCSHQIGC